MKDFFVPKDLLLFSNSMGINSDFYVRGFSAGASKVMGTLTVTVSTSSIPTDGLVLLYDCETNTNNILVDASGNNRNGTINESSIVTGRFGNALQFNGSSSHGASSAHMKNISTGFALSMWVNLTIRNNTYDCLWMMDTGAASTRMRLFNYNGTTQGVCFQVGSIALNNTGGQNPSGITHILAQYNASTGLMELFFNNTLVDSGTTSTGLSTPNMTALIGKSPYAPYYAISGWVDQIRFYSRPLNAEERTALYEEAI